MKEKTTHLITLTDDQGMLDLSNGFIVWVLCLSSGERLPFSYQTCSIFHFFLSTWSCMLCWVWGMWSQVLEWNMTVSIKHALLMEGESISSFFPPQCWLLLAAHVANSPQIKLNIQIDKVVHATFKFTDSRQSNQTYPRQHEILHYWWRTQVITQKNIKTRSQ